LSRLNVRLEEKTVQLEETNVLLDQTKEQLGQAIERGGQRARKLVAERLHSEIQHYFSTGIVLLNKCMKKQNTDETIEEALSELKDGKEAGRRIMEDLYPPEFDDPHATFLDWMQALAKRNSKLLPTDVQDSSNKSINQIDRERAMSIHLILSNALLNIYKHAEATQARISCSSQADAYVIAVSDDGKGMARENGGQPVSTSYGLSDMKAQ
jgi:signal transduction histidine kinase